MESSQDLQSKFGANERGAEGSFRIGVEGTLTRACRY